MDTITGLSKEHYEWKVKFCKKMVIATIFWLLFALSVNFYDYVQVIHTHDYKDGIAFGMMLITAIWAIFYLIEQLSDLKAAKSSLKFHTELYEKQLASGEREQYLNAKQAYENMIKTYSPPQWNADPSLNIMNGGIHESNEENKS